MSLRDTMRVYEMKLYHVCDSLADMMFRDCDEEHDVPVWRIGLDLLRADPGRWFRDNQVDDRDLALINASPLPWVDIGPESVLKTVYHKLKAPHNRSANDSTWVAEEDRTLLEMISEGGAAFIGFDTLPVHGPVRNWLYVAMDVVISGNIAPGVTRQMFSGSPSKVRVLHAYAPPKATRPLDDHPLDIMILRDFRPDTSRCDRIACRQYDILLMKTGKCEDREPKHPWAVVAVKDSGPRWWFLA